MNKKISMIPEAKIAIQMSTSFLLPFPNSKNKSKTEQEKAGAKLLYSQSSFQIKKKNTKHDKCLRKSQCL